MMKKIKAIFILSVITYFNTYSQALLKNTNDLLGYNEIHQEKIFIHYNSSLFFAGEELYYKMYCLDVKTNLLSSLSKVGYVELIGENKKVVFKQETKLSLGFGQGDFFIPTTIPSGSYKLLGYTQWMKNNENNNFFESNIGIINPYQSNQNVILTNIDVIKTDTIYKPKLNNTQITSIVQHNNDKHLKLTLNKKNFERRSKVELTFSALNDSISHGSYSISVRKENNITETSIPESNTILNDNEKNINHKSLGDKIFLPESRGKLFYGSVINKSTKSSVKNIKIGLSIPGKDFIFKVATTNKEGLFYFNLDEDYVNSEAIVQILDNKKEEYKIIINQDFSLDYDDLVFEKLKITPKMRNIILERSIYNQIENAYFGVKEEPLKTNNLVIPFYRNFSEVYNLNYYTRFSTIKETLVEIVNFVRLAKSENGEYVFQVEVEGNLIGLNLSPLIIVDGVVIQNHNDVINFDARKIEKISVFRHKFSSGSKTYKGLISFETQDGNYRNTMPKDYLVNINFFKPPLKKTYFNKVYSDKTKVKSNQIPDFRQQLLWIPNLKLNKDGTTIEFFTSDIIGNYEIRVEGFTVKGKPVSIKEVITVE